jgi:diguanylate cyclase (GGDEF)-like protein/PAS domain S-box-containing protein
MTIETFLTLIFKLIPIGIVTFLGLYAWRERKITGAASFAWLMLCIALWLIIILLEEMLPETAIDNFWHNLRFLAVAFIPVAFFTFIITYNGKSRWLTRQRILLLLIIPTLSQFIIWSNPYHGWFVVGLISEASMKNWSPGPWFWVHTCYSYGLLLISLGQVFRTLFQSFRPYRMQASALLLGAMLPLSLNVAMTLKLIPPNSAIAFYSLAFTGLIYAWGIFRHRLLNLVPVARDTLFDTMSDGMLTVDRLDRIVDMNPAMQAILQQPANTLIGKPASQTLVHWPAITQTLQTNTAQQIEFSHQQQNMLHYYDLRSFTLFNHRNVQTGILIILRNITTLKETQLALQEMAITDPLTGLHNRRHFFQIAGQEIERSLRYGHPLTAIMIDIDHFKQVNDTCGHIDGDQVLRSLAMCLQQNTRQVDILCRYGGEEFILLLAETGIDQALQTAERIRQQIETMPIIIGGTEIRITASLGLAEMRYAENLEQLLRHADQAMYAAKRAGRNRIRTYIPQDKLLPLDNAHNQ